MAILGETSEFGRLVASGYVLADNAYMVEMWEKSDMSEISEYHVQMWDDSDDTDIDSFTTTDHYKAAEIYMNWTFGI